MKSDCFTKNKSNYTMEELIEVIEVLRSPAGCAWDREQTSKSLRRDFLEECYEALEAIDTGDQALLREELGDVLLHIVFQSSIAKDAGQFTFEDVASDVAAKMVQRHPHVFADVQVSGTEEILQNWDAIKMETKGQTSLQEMLKSVSSAMPALMRHQKVLKKAGKNGVPIPMDSLETIRRLTEEEELDGETIGELLAQVVCLAQRCGVDAEQVLSENTKKFIGTVNT